MNAAELLKQYEPAPGADLAYQRQLFQARYSPCGDWLIACSYDSTIQRWDVTGETPEPKKPLVGHNGWTQCIGFHPEKRHLYSADSWGRLMCRPFAEDAPRPIWQQAKAHDGWITALTVDPAGELIATSSNRGEIHLWQSKSGNRSEQLPAHPSKIFSLIFAPDGKSLVFGDQLGVIHQWDLAQAKVVRTFDASRFYALDRIQDCGGARHLMMDGKSKYLLCAGQREPGGGFAKGVPSILVFDWKSGEVVQEMPMGANTDGFAYDAQWHPDGFVMGTSCAFPNKGHVWFWRPGDQEAFFTSKKLPNGRSLSLHPDGRRLAMTVSESRNRNGRPDGEYEGGTGKIRILTFPEPG